MKFYRNLLIAVALTPAISFTTSALAASKADSSRSTSVVSGVVVGIDRSARTLLVRDDDGNKTTVHVPEGRLVALSQNANVWAGASAIEFERAQRGIHVRMVTE